jgi:hypothetical protein
MMREPPIAVVVTIALGVSLWTFAAHARPSSWLTAARQCETEISRSCPTNCTNALWPRYAACANDRVQDPIPAHEFDLCIAAVKSRQQLTHPCEACWDPALEVAKCAHLE